MANNYYERGDRLNVYLAAELPEEMTGQQDTRHICGNCAWYSFAKLESTCRKTGKEVAYFATKECFTTEKDTTMEEENTNAQPVAETGTQVCKECGRTLPLEDFQRRRYGKRDKVCKACRAEKIRVGMATGKEKKVDIPEKKPAEWSEGNYDIISNISNQVYKAIRRTLASLAVYDEDEKLLESKEATLSYYSQQCAEEIFKALRPSWKPADEPVVILKTADFSDAALLEELRRRGYKGTITKVQEVEI